MSIAYQDGQLIRLAPNCLKDMHSGGVIIPFLMDVRSRRLRC